MVFARESHFRAFVLLMCVAFLLDAVKGEEVTTKPEPNKEGGGGGAGKNDTGGELRNNKGLTKGDEANGDPILLCKMMSKSYDRTKQHHWNKLCKDVDVGMRKKDRDRISATMITETPTQNWTCDNWKFMLGDGAPWFGWRNKFDISDDCLGEIAEDDNMVEKLKSNRVMAKKLRSWLQKTLGDTTGWSSTNVEKAKHMFGTMALSKLKLIPNNALKSALANLKDVKFKRSAVKAVMMEKVMQGLGGAENAGQWTSTDIINSDQYIRHSPKAVAKLSDNAFKTALETLSKNTMKRRDAVLYAKRLRNLPDFKNATGLDKDKLAQMGTLLGSMGSRYLRDIPDDKVAESIDVFKNLELSRAEKRILIKKSQISPSNITDVVDTFGNLVAGIQASDLEEIPATAFKNIRQFKSLKLGRIQRRVVVSKLLAGHPLKTGIATQLGSLIQVLKTSELKGFSFDALKLACNETETFDMDVTDIQANMMFDTVMSEMGKSGEGQYTSACFERWGCFARKAMSASFVDGLPLNDQLVQIADALADNDNNYMDACVMGTMAAKKMAWKLAEQLDLNDMEIISSLTDADEIITIARFLPYINQKTFEYFTPEVVVRLIPIIGLGARGVPREVYTKLKDLALTYVQGENDTIQSLNESGRIEADHLNNMGFLRCYMTPSDIRRLTFGALETHLGDMQTCPFTFEQSNELYKKYVQYFSNTTMSAADIIRGAGILHYMSDDELGNVDQGVLADSYADVLQVLAEKHRVRRYRDQEGFKDEMSPDERKTEAEQENRLVRAFITAVAAQEEVTTSNDNSTNANETNSETRKRREANDPLTLTCSDIHAAGDAAKSFGPGMLETLSEDEFDDCAEQLGDIDTWSVEQLAALKTVAVLSWGSPTDWTTERLVVAGNILASLTVEEISDLGLDKTVTVLAAANSDLFSSAQREIMFKVWFSKVKGNDMTTVSAEEIMQLGKLACGASGYNIKRLPVVTYKDSTATWGSINTCGLEQRQAIAGKAEEAFGDPSQWTLTTLREIGVSVVEVSRDALTMIPVYLFKEIPPSHIKQMRPEVFSGLTEEQLAGMTDEQKAVVSADQRNAVSAKKKGALTGIVDVTDDKVDSGATGDDEDDDSAAPGEEASKSSAADPASNSARLAAMLLSLGIACVVLRK